MASRTLERVFNVQKTDAQCDITLDGKSMTADHSTMPVQPTALKPKDDSAVTAGSTRYTTALPKTNTTYTEDRYTTKML